MDICVTRIRVDRWHSNTTLTLACTLPAHTSFVHAGGHRRQDLLPRPPFHLQKRHLQRYALLRSRRLFQGLKCFSPRHAEQALDEALPSLVFPYLNVTSAVQLYAVVVCGARLLLSPFHQDANSMRCQSCLVRRCSRTNAYVCQCVSLSSFVRHLRSVCRPCYALDED